MTTRTTVTITRETNKLVRRLLESERSFLQNIICGAVDVGAAQYVDTGLTGFEYAQKLVRRLREVEGEFTTFVPDDMWGKYSHVVTGTPDAPQVSDNLGTAD